ncbi:hypothetical protein PTUN_a0238 [Pseudoalteromonas tunicata]|nr:hypothetical protein PTUN_a0238 [Pseudoalteromonas tunicata]
MNKKFVFIFLIFNLKMDFNFDFELDPVHDLSFSTNTFFPISLIGVGYS